MTVPVHPVRTAFSASIHDIACIEDPAIIDKNLQHLQARGVLPQPPELLPVARVSPQADWIE